jgi:predicted small lipoprotein YifL
MSFSRLFAFPVTSILRAALLVTISFSLLVSLSACGKKGPVRPKVAIQLEAPTDVTLQQQGNLFVLGWTIPSDKRVGSAEDLTGFIIKRLTYNATEGCPTCRTPEDEVAELDIKDPTPGQRIGNRIYWRDFDIREGTGYRYAIVPVTLGNIEAPFATIHLEVRQSPPAPGGLKAESGDGQIALQWDAPTLPEGLELLGYNLYRRQAKRPFPIVPVNVKPLQETHLLDRGLDKGRAYEYRVSALVSTGTQQLESMPSPGVLMTPQ